MTILSSSNSELVYVCLCHIDVLLSKVPKLFEQEYRSFFSRYGGGLRESKAWLGDIHCTKYCYFLHCVSPYTVFLCSLYFVFLFFLL